MQRTGSILIVDSEPAIVDLLFEVLTDAGYIALTSSDIASASQMIINYAPALLLLDLHMPGMRSSGLVTQLRGVSASDIPIVLMTTEPRAAEALLVPGSLMCLSKPFDIDNLLACVACYVQPNQSGFVTQICTPT